MKGVQCYELFGGIALKNHTFSFSFLCYPGESLEGPILTGVCKKLNNVDSNNDIQI